MLPRIFIGSGFAPTTVTATVAGSDYGSHTSHTFIADGTFTLTNGDLAVDVLLVAGGGSGGSAGSGSSSVSLFRNLNCL